MAEQSEGYEFFEFASVPRDQVSLNSLDAETRAAAIFGNVSYQATDRLGLHGGVRFAYEDRSGDVAVTSASGTYMYGMPQSGSADISDFNVSPEIGLGYKLSETSLVYGRVSTGYKSGGIAQFFDASGQVNTYQPEKSVNVEAGLKTRLWDDRIALNVAVFHTKWDDQQANVFISDFQRVTANAAQATSQGIEVELDAQLTDELRARVSYGYLDAAFEEFRYTYFSQGTGQNVTVDYSGNAIPLAPEHSASLTLEWAHDLSPALTLLAEGTYSYRSRYSFDPVGTYKQPESHVIDASISLQGEAWEGRLWGRNLLDEDYLSNYFLFGATDYGIAAPGRTVGLTLSRRW